MRNVLIPGTVICALIVTGCVSSGTHQQTLAELEQTRKTSAQTAAELETLKKQAAAQAEGLIKQLETAQQQLANAKKALNNASVRLASLEQEKEQVTAVMAQSLDEARNLSTKLEVEQSQISALREDQQRLMSGTTKAQEEIARMEKRAGELETEATRAKDLEQRLSERDQEIGTLRETASDREALASKVATLTQQIDHLAADVRKQQDAVKAQEERLKAEEAETVRLEQERAAKEAEIQRLTQAHDDLTKQLRAEIEKADELQGKSAALQKEREQLMIATGDQESQLKQAEAEKARLEQERLAKEAEIQRLTQTHDDLTKQLRAEIEKGNIKIQQVHDKLTINMLEQVLFDSGQAKIKPAGLKVLKQVSDILKNVTDKQIRIEGHTDNVPIGPKIQDRFPTNWELATARATSVVRFLIDKGGVVPAKLSAVGYADTHPVANNDTEQGRAANRRIEIVLFPEDLTRIASQIMP